MAAKKGAPVNSKQPPITAILPCEPLWFPPAWGTATTVPMDAQALVLFPLQSWLLMLGCMNVPCQRTHARYGGLEAFNRFFV
jgi:hypothetical protein